MSPVKLDLATSFYLGAFTHGETSGLHIEWEPLWTLEGLRASTEMKKMCCYCKRIYATTPGFFIS